MNPILIALLPLIGAAVGASLQFLFGRNLEGRKQLMLQRAQAYIDFGRGLAADPSIDNQRLLADAKIADSYLWLDRCGSKVGQAVC